MLTNLKWKLLPMMQLFSDPNAQTHCGPLGTWNLQKLQLELKYFGKKLEAKLDCLFKLWSSNANIWMVPWSLATHIIVESALKLILK